MAKIVFLFLTVCLLMQTPPRGNWGHAIGSYQGVIAYSNGNDTGKATLTEPVGRDGKKYQCVEYCRRFYRVHLGIDTSGWEINANAWYTMSRFWGLRRIPE